MINPIDPGTSVEELRRLAREYPLPMFFALAYAITWVTLAPLVLSETGAAVLPIRVPIEYSVMGLVPHWAL